MNELVRSTEKFFAFLAVNPWPRMLFIEVKMARTMMFMFELTASTPTDRDKFGVAACPLMAALRFYEWCVGMVTKSAVFTLDAFCHTYEGS